MSAAGRLGPEQDHDGLFAEGRRIPLLLVAVTAALAPLVALASAFDPAETPQRLLIQTGVLVALALLIWGDSPGVAASLSGPLGEPVLALALWATLSLPRTSDLCSGLASVSGWWAFWAALLATTCLARRAGAARLLLSAVFFSGMACAAVGLAQVFFGVGWYPQAVAPGGTLMNRAVAAEYVAVTAPLAIAVIGFRLRSKALKLAAGLGGVAMAGFVLSTGSRAATLAVMAAGAVLVLSRRRLLRSTRARALGALAVILLGLVPFALALGGSRSSGPAARWRSGLDTLFSGSQTTSEGSNDSSPEAARSVIIRLAVWRNTLRMIAERPLAGHGAGSFAAEYPRVAAIGPASDRLSPLLEVEHPHNEGLKLAAELGLVGIVLVLWLGWRVVVLARRRPSEDQPGAGGAERDAALAAVVPFVVVSCFSLPLRWSAFQLVLAIVLGVLQAPRLQVSTEGVAARGAAPPLARWRWAVAGVTLAAAIGLLGWNSLRLAGDVELLRATNAAEGKDWTLARAAARQATECDPCNRKAYSLAGLSLLRAGRPADAVQALRRPAQRWPTSVNIVGNLGAALVASGRYAEAQAPLRAALWLRPDSQVARFLLASATASHRDSRSDGSAGISSETQPACPAQIQVRVEGEQIGLSGEGGLGEFLACLAKSTGLEWSAEDRTILRRRVKVEVPPSAPSVVIAHLLEGLGVDYAISYDPAGRHARSLLLVPSSQPQASRLPARSPYPPEPSGWAEPDADAARIGGPESPPEETEPASGGRTPDQNTPQGVAGAPTPVQPGTPSFPEPRPLTLTTPRRP
jgi:O-antigen ligase